MSHVIKKKWGSHFHQQVKDVFCSGGHLFSKGRKINNFRDEKHLPLHINSSCLQFWRAINRPIKITMNDPAIILSRTIKVLNMISNQLCYWQPYCPNIHEDSNIQQDYLLTHSTSLNDFLLSVLFSINYYCPNIQQDYLLTHKIPVQFLKLPKLFLR